MHINTCGIYSFPKSGNTWVREIVRGLFNVEDDISKAVPEYFNRPNQKPAWDVLNAPNGKKWVFYKSHSLHELDGNNINGLNNDLIIYLLRNPFDVFCSQLNWILKGYAESDRKLIKLNHANIDEVVTRGDMDIYFTTFIAFGTLTPLFLETSSWMDNVTYWIERSKQQDNVILVKYEDLISNPKNVVATLFDGFGFSSSEIDHALIVAGARTTTDGSFFWKKKAGTYHEYLDKSMIDLFVKHHGEVLNAAGYYNL